MGRVLQWTCWVVPWQLCRGNTSWLVDVNYVVISHSVFVTEVLPTLMTSSADDKRSSLQQFYDLVCMYVSIFGISLSLIDN